MTFDLMSGVPGWYVVVAIVWSIYQGVRGWMEQRLHAGQAWFDRLEPWQKFVLLYLHDFAFRFICTMAGFLALFVCYQFVESARADMSAGTATVIIASFLVGVVGVGGQLHYLVLLGKVPTRA